jgi:hypothetical protein
MTMKFLLQSLRLKSARILTRPVSWRPDLKVWRHWLEPGISWIRLVSGKVSRSRIIQLAQFAKACVSIGRKQGPKGLVLYLKVCNVALMQSLPGGQLSFHSRKIGKVAVARSRDGLPRIMPAFVRTQIRSGNRDTIRLWLTFFGMYRVMPCKGRPNFASIVGLGRTLNPPFLADWSSFVRNTFLPGIQSHSGEVILGKGTSLLERPTPFVISSVSADRFEDPAISQMVSELKQAKKPVPKWLSGTPTSFAHRFSSARFWSNTPGPEGFASLGGNLLLNYLKLVPGGWGTTKSLWTMLEDTAVFYPQARAAIRGTPPGEQYKEALLPNAHGYGKNVCGRLALLPEAAGKIRIVALADPWTQWALHPLHEWIFTLLKELDEDGTFDQLKPINRLMKRVKPETVIYSYDLSSATDRIPVLVQELLLAEVFGPDYAKAWRELLVGRPYVIPKRVAREQGVGTQFLRYAVGQPMGAYSSWAMLALTHHAMVQYSAQRAGIKGWFTLYAVLGDDIVIADDRVARKYRALCKLLGVEIGLAKSLVSSGKTLEFAKRFFYQGSDLSGMPTKFWAAAQSQSGVACALAAWYPTGSLGNFVRALGGGFRVASKVATARWNKLSRRALALCVSLTNPVMGARLAFRTWPEWLWSKSADASRPLDESLLTQLTPFCTAVQQSLVDPAIGSLEDYQEDLFFTEKLEDPVTRVTDALANKAIAGATNSLELHSKSLRHLQGLNIKMNLVQVSAIITQIWKSVDKAGLVPLPSTKATVRPELDPFALRVSSVFKYWSQLRKLAAPESPLRGTRNEVAPEND